MGKISWGKDGMEQLLVEYLSDEVNANKYFGTKDTVEKDDWSSKLTICKVIGFDGERNKC